MDPPIDKDITRWLGREDGEVNFYLTQFLTGHEYFRYYLYKLSKVNTPKCKYCGHERDDAEHTFFAYSSWAVERQRLEVIVGRLSPDVAIECMLSRKDGWNVINTSADGVLRAKNRDGRLRD